MSDSEDEEKEPKPVLRNSSSESSYEEDEEVHSKPGAQPSEHDIKDGQTLVGEVQSQEEKMTSMQKIQQPQPRRKRFIPNYDVEGVTQVTLSEDTQIAIEMVIGTHVNAQFPWKTIEKDKILENIELGGEMSEFFPMKELLEEYPDDTILMGYIADESKDTDDFYVCCTVQARDHCKEQSERFIRRQEKKLEKAVQKKPKPWTSLGSEQEIIEVIPVNSRTLMEIEIKAKFPKEYEPKAFDVRDTNAVRDGCIELTPYRQKFSNVFRRRVDCATQVAPARVESYAQTVLKYPKNMWTQSIADSLGKFGDEKAGGDTDMPNKDDESSSDEDAAKEAPVDEVGMASYVAAFKRLRRPSYVKLINTFMVEKQNEMTDFIELNTVMDMYCNDYPDLIAHKTIDTYATMTFEEYVCFTHVRGKDKYISSAVFHPMWSGIVALSYADGSPTVMKTLGTRSDPIQRAVYGLNPVMIWSHLDSLIPKLYLESPREVISLSFCPFDENILIGGLINGQIVIWDLTNKLENVEKIEVLSELKEKYRIAMNANMGWMKPVQDNAIVTATVLSNLMHCHYGPVTSIGWVSPNFSITPQGKTLLLAPEDPRSMQFITGSVDGNLLVWDLSLESIGTMMETQKVKKSKRIQKRPSALLVDISPLKPLDRVLRPIYKIILGVAGEPEKFTLQAFAMSRPPINYVYTQKPVRTGRKYFSCEIIPQREDEINSIFYCSSQHGQMRRITWEGHEFNTGEIVNSEYCGTKFSCSMHDGIISSTQKNPHIDSLTLTVGGKIFAIWSDKILNRPLIWKKRPYLLTNGVWSLYKPSLLFITNCEGSLEVWDLLLKSDLPISIQTLSGSMLTGVSLHTLPLVKNIIGVSDVNGSLKLFLNPPIFMLESQGYKDRMESMINRELKVMLSFNAWQDRLMKDNPEILLEIRRKEGAALAAKEAEKRKEREDFEKKLEEEAEAQKMKKQVVVTPEEKWQRVIQKLIERTIAVKKRINRAELMEQERPLKELEVQRLEKERRMLEIMKNQKQIFSDTVAILFPEAIKKPEPVKESLLSSNKEALKKEILEDYYELRKSAIQTVHDNPYKVPFSWDTTLAEGRERRQSLNAQNDLINIHRARLLEDKQPSAKTSLQMDTCKRVTSQKEVGDERTASQKLSVLAHQTLESDDEVSTEA